MNDRWPFTVAAWLFALGALIPDRTYESRAEAISRYRFLPTSDHASEALRAHIASGKVKEYSRDDLGAGIFIMGGR